MKQASGLCDDSNVLLFQLGTNVPAQEDEEKAAHG
jgi:hypothetical protein